MKVICLILLFGSLHLGVSTQSIIATANDPVWRSDFDMALQEARLQQKQVLIYFSGSDWCKPCMRLRKEVFETSLFRDFAARHLVLVKADFPRLRKNQLSKQQKDHNEQLAEKYNPGGDFPLVVLIDPAHGIKGMAGYQSQGVNKYMVQLQQLME